MNENISTAKKKKKNGAAGRNNIIIMKIYFNLINQGSEDQTLRNAIREHTLYMVVTALMSMLYTPCPTAATKNMFTGASKYTTN